MPGTLINVCGMPRSGTTVLSLMLGSGSDVIACGEACSWFRVARHRTGAHPPKIYEPVADADEKSFHSLLLDHTNCSYVVDSSKTFDWIVDHTRWASETNLNVYNVLIYKDPIDGALSWWKRGNLDRFRNYYVRYHLQIILSGIGFISLSYNDLVNRPTEVTRALCAATGLPYFAGKEKFWEYDFDLFGANSKGVKDQVSSRKPGFHRPSMPPEFQEIHSSLFQSLKKDQKVQNVLSRLRSQKFDLDSSMNPLPPHDYSPSISSRLAFYLYRTLKKPWVRARWNLIEPYFGSTKAVA